jgi:two-component system sensor histidine kinase KdpD
LAITRVESGAELHRDWVPVEEVVGSALERSEAALAGHDVHIELAADIGVLVDPILFEQLLLNLLENAAKHTPAGTPIEIRAVPEACGEAGGVAIEIADRGPGLPAGPEDQVFQKFFRGPGAHAVGAGLGLAVCRGIANAHGGTIDARRRPGGGATFHVWLPGGDAPSEPLRPAAPGLEATAS